MGRFCIAAIASVFGLALIGLPTLAADEPKFITAKELDELPTGIKVVHKPKTALATLTGKSERRAKYTWWYKTTVSATDADVTIEEFGAFVWWDDKWHNGGTFSGKPYGAEEFAEWYKCPKAVLKKGKSQEAKRCGIVAVPPGIEAFVLPLQMTCSQLQRAALLATCLTTINACDSKQLERASRYNQRSAGVIASRSESESDVQRIVSTAAAADRAVMFIHLDWAPMEPQRSRYVQFANDWLQLHPRDNLGFYYLDCTPVDSGYAPLRRLTGWVELEVAAGTSLIHGWGELVWMERGRVLHVERIQNFESISELLNKTEALMPTKHRG